MRMSEKCHNNNNSDNSWTSRRTDGGKNKKKSHLIFIFPALAFLFTYIKSEFSPAFSNIFFLLSSIF